jgi:hypothetical protein
MLINISVAHKDARYWNQSWTHANYFFLFFYLGKKADRANKNAYVSCTDANCKDTTRIFRRRRVTEAAMYIYTPLVSVGRGEEHGGKRPQFGASSHYWNRLIK